MVDTKGELNVDKLNKLSQPTKNNLDKVIQAAKRRKQPYDKLYLQYVVLPAIILRMGNAGKKMSDGKLILKKGQRRINGS